jgi:hypothetical protein
LQQKIGLKGNEMSGYLGGIIVALFIACVGLGYGWHHSHDSLVQYRAEVAQAGRDQAAIAKQKEIEYEKNAMVIANSYSDAYERLQHARTNSSAVSSTSKYSLSAHATVSEFGNTCTRDFYWNALADALKVQKFQEWVTSNHIPIKN